MDSLGARRTRSGAGPRPARTACPGRRSGSRPRRNFRTPGHSVDASPAGRKFVLGWAGATPLHCGAHPGNPHRQNHSNTTALRTRRTHACFPNRATHSRLLIPDVTTARLRTSPRTQPQRDHVSTPDRTTHSPQRFTPNATHFPHSLLLHSNPFHRSHPLTLINCSSRLDHQICSEACIW